MRWIKRITLGLVVLLILVFSIAWLRGSSLPVHHTTTVVGEVNASPEKVWALITTVSAQPTWRTGLISIEPLPAEAGKEHWREHLAHNQTMDFIADETVPTTRRVVRLDLPNGSYTGSWIYELTSGATPSTSHVSITEDGNIYPAIYRTLMHDVIGMKSNLNQYLTDLQKAATSSTS
jgi:uncharacterized protein YndB with AHSA1/START domain